MSVKTAVQQYGLPAVVCAFPLILLLDLSRIFEIDWVNHTWLIAQHGQSVLNRFRFLEAVNSTRAIGLVDPMFAGQMLYSLLGVLSAFCGPDLAIRLGVFAALWLQYLEIRRTVLATGADTVASHTVAVLGCWTIYPLTNLYQRSAITEFFAICLLTCATCCLLRLPLLPDGRTANQVTARFALYFAVAAMSHPITALFGTAFAIVIMLTGLVSARWSLASLLRLAAAGLVIGAVMSPWIYLLLRFRSTLNIALEPHRLYRFDFDVLWVRLLPVPLDPRSLFSDIAAVSTPYLNTQINMPLLAFGLAIGTGVAAIVWRNRHARLTSESSMESDIDRRAGARYGWALCAAGVAVASVTLATSTSSALASRVPPPFTVAQFAYRLVSYVNLGLLMLAVGVLVAGRNRIDWASTRVRATSAALIAVAAVSVLQQQIYAGSISARRLASQSEAHVLLMPSVYYAAGEYTVTAGVRKTATPGPTATVTLLPYGGRRFGDVQPTQVRLEQPARVLTNVLAFPWNTLTVSGKVVPSHALSVWYRLMVIDLPAGTHRIGYRFEPDPVWRALRILSWATFVLLLVGVAVLCRGLHVPGR